MGLAMRPERDLGAVEELDGGGASHPLGAGGADLVAALERVEIKLLGVGGAGRRLELRMAVRMEALDDLEQVLRRRLLVSEDEDAHALGVDGAVVEARRHIGRAALLAALEDQRPHAAGLAQLRVEAAVNELLRAVEDQPRERAALGADGEDGGEARQVALELALCLRVARS